MAIQRRASEEVSTSKEVATPATHNSYKRDNEEEEVTSPAVHNSYKRGDEEEETTPLRSTTATKGAKKKKKKRKRSPHQRSTTATRFTGDMPRRN